MGKYGLGQILRSPAYRLNPRHLVTNTWQGRHEFILSRLQQAVHGKFHDVSIAIFGPGGIAEKYADRLPYGDESKFRGSWKKIFQAEEIYENTMCLLRRGRQQIISVRESRERDKPDARLITFEPREIYEALSPIGIRKMTVYDKYQQVLDATLSLNIPVLEAKKIDIEDECESFPTYDIVFFLKIHEYCEKNPAGAYDFVKKAVRNGGLLVHTLPKDLEITGFTRISDNIHEKGTVFSAPKLNSEELMRAAKSASPKPVKVKI